MDSDSEFEFENEFNTHLRDPDFILNQLDHYIIFDRVEVPNFESQDIYLETWDDLLDKFCLLCPSLVDTVVAITDLPVSNIDFEFERDSFSYLFNRLRDAGHRVDILPALYGSATVYGDDTLDLTPDFVKAWLLSFWSRTKYNYWASNTNACHRCALDYRGRYNREVAFGVVSWEEK